MNNSDFQATIEPIRSVLFVDFDNIYLGLKQLDEAAAERFANEPARWLSWMERGMPSNGDEGAPSPDEQALQRRHILVRRCYLNPRDFYRYRPNFPAPLSMSSIALRSRFRARTAPTFTWSWTSWMRWSTALISMSLSSFLAMLTSHPCYSGCTPTIGGRPYWLPGVEAYKAACNMVIPEDVFIEYALGMSADISEMTPVAVIMVPRLRRQPA